MQQTGNYQLSQWEKADRIQMEDFNGDNEKIDAALAAETAARESLAAAVAKCGNCRVALTSYTGNGLYGAENPTRVTFEARPLAFFIFGEAALIIGTKLDTQELFTLAYNGNAAVTPSVNCSWSGNQLSFWSTAGNYSGAFQANRPGATYRVLALYAQDA